MPDEGIEPPTFGLQNRCSTAELIRRLQAAFALSASRAARKGALQAEPAATVGVHGPSTGTASSMPGQGGMVIATNASGRAGVGAELKRGSERDGQRRPGARADRSIRRRPGAARCGPAADHEPDLLDRSMRDRVRDRAGGQFEMRHASAGEAQKQAHRRSVRRGGVDAMRPASWFRKAWSPASDKRLVVRRGRQPRCLGAAIGGLLRKDMTNPSLTADQALDEFRAAGALLTGHFILSSGLHSPVFLQKMFVFQDPARTERLCRALAEKAREAFGAIDIVASPALGGIVPGYETARWLGAKAIFVEREGGVFKLRRGFAIAPGARVLMVEDIITTGLSSRETLAALAEHPGTIVGAACLIDRSDGKADIGVKRVALATLDIPAYAPDALPPELAALPAVKPGSRALAGAA